MGTDYEASNAEYDWLDFDTRDDYDANASDHARELIWGLPARPGTRR